MRFYKFGIDTLGESKKFLKDYSNDKSSKLIAERAVGKFLIHNAFIGTVNRYNGRRSIPKILKIVTMFPVAFFTTMLVIPVSWSLNEAGFNIEFHGFSIIHVIITPVFLLIIIYYYLSPFFPQLIYAYFLILKSGKSKRLYSKDEYNHRLSQITEELSRFVYPDQTLSEILISNLHQFNFNFRNKETGSKTKISGDKIALIFKDLVEMHKSEYTDDEMRKYIVNKYFHSEENEPINDKFVKRDLSE